MIFLSLVGGCIFNNPKLLPNLQAKKSSINDHDEDNEDNQSSTTSSDQLNGAESHSRRKVQRKKRITEGRDKSAMNTAGRSSLIMKPKKKNYDPPKITITTAPDETGDENENERDTEAELFAHSAVQPEEESQQQQIIASTSSSADAPNLLADDNQTQRRQLPSMATISMNNSRNNNNGLPPFVQNHQHLALTYYAQHLHPVLQQQQQRRLSELPTNHQPRPTPGSNSSAVYQVPIRARDAIATTLSALYGKLIVVMGISFPMAEVISTYIPPSFYEAFYLYLYIVSMIFLLFMYVTLLWGRPKLSVQQLADNFKMQNLRREPPPPPLESERDSGEESDQESSLDDQPPPLRRGHVNIIMPPTTPSVHHAPPRRHSFLIGSGTSASGHNKGSSHGSFYLRMGAVGKSR